jgi:hypothetical protein
MANEFKVKNGIIISCSADIEQNLTVRGTLTADQYNVSIVSTSILYESGSTKFGDSLDDLHEFTGSVTITGSISLNGQAIGTGKLDETTFNSYTSSISSSIGGLSSSIATIDSNQNNRLDSLESASGSIRTDFNSFTSSYTTVSGSLDSRLDVLEAYSGSQLVPSSSMSFRTLQTDVYCKNSTGTQINKGTVVRIVGAVGDNPLIGIADPTTEHASANTLGITTQDIPNDDFGLVITEGVLIGVNTSGMTAGDLLYLGANGSFTTTPSVAPNHGVRLGEVLRDQQNQGSIYVRIDNGMELNEAHDVIYTGITHGDLLVRSGSLWKNSKSLEGNYTVTGSLTVTQNLTVLGSSSLVYVTSSNLSVSASFISVNVFEPAERFGGLKVYDSGSSNATASLAWDSQHNHWVYQNVDGANYSGGMLLSGPRNSGSLGDEPGLINGRIVKSVGGDHLDVSIISETGTTITIAGDLSAVSFTGSGAGLYNIPASGVTGLQLDKIISGNASASIDNTGLYVNRDLYVDGTITAKEFHTDYYSSSVLFQSGSTKLGDSYLDTHQFTGSVLVNGNINATSITGSINFNNLTDLPTLVSGSSQISYTGLTNIPAGIVSGSEQLTSSYDARYVLSGSITQTTWDNIANKPSGITSGSSQIVDLGFLETSSFNTYTSSNDGRVSSLESKTGSYATTGSNVFIGTERVTGSLLVSGSVVISGSLDITNANVGSSRFLYTQTTGSTTWNIPHNLGYSYPNVTVYDGSNNKVMLPADVISIDANNTQVTFATAEYGYALVSVGGISTGTADRLLHTQDAPTGSWVIDHNLGYKYPNVDVYDSNDEQLIPQKIKAVSVNRIEIDFISPTSGHAIISMGGQRSTSLFTQNGYYYTTQNNIGITGSLIVSGDVDAANFNSTSDSKLKIDLIKIEGALDKIEKLNGYTFNWLEEYSEDRTRQIGMLADEVYDVQPELISKRTMLLGGKEEEIKLLDYAKVNVLLVEGIKELTKRVIKLENKK